MNKRAPAKKPQAKIQTAKKQILVKKIASDRVEELVKKHLGNIGEAENAFKSASYRLAKPAEVANVNHKPKASGILACSTRFHGLHAQRPWK